MDYTEMLFALEVKKIVSGRMSRDIREQIEKERKNMSSEEFKTFKQNTFDSLNYEKYVNDIIFEIEKTVSIIKNH